MATEKLIKSIFTLRYDELANWNSANPVLRKGEIGIVAIPKDSADKDGTQVNPPAVLFKVGDGTTPWASLPYASGLAADVHGWAKGANKPEYSASEIKATDGATLQQLYSGTTTHINSKANPHGVTAAQVGAYTKEEVDDLIAEIPADENTKYQLVQSGTVIKLQSKEVNGSWSDVDGQSFDLATILSEKFDAKGAAQTAEGNAKSYVDSEIDKVEGTIGGLGEQLASIQGRFTDGKANQAIADGAGNVIVDTYATKGELFSKDYNDLTNKPEIPSIDGLATEQYVQDQIDLIEIPEVPVQSVNGKTGAVVLKAADITNEDGITLERLGDYYGEHFNNKENPHEVTAAQVGAYTKAEVDALIPEVPVESVNGKTGAVVLGAGDVGAYTKAEVDTELNELSGNLQGQIDDLDNSLSQRITNVETVVNGTDADTMDSVAELINYVKEHGTEVTGIKNDISDLDADLTGLQGDLTDTIGRVETIESKPAMDITAENISKWNNEVGAKAAVNGLNEQLSSIQGRFTEGKANQAIADGAGNNIVETYATKAALKAVEDKVDAIEIPEVPVDSVNGKTGAVVLKAADITNEDGVTLEQVSDSYAAHANNKENPHGVTAAQVGAYTKAEVDGLIQGVEDLIPEVPVQSVNGKTGAVVLGAGDVGAYTKAEVESELNELSGNLQGQIDDLDTDLGNLSSEVNNLAQDVDAINEAGYTTNKGTVTSVTIKTGTGLKVNSTDAITESGERTIEIDDSVVFVFNGGNAAGEF